MTSPTEVLHEERIIVREERDVDGNIRVTVHIEGDSDKVNENEPISLAYATAVSIFHLFQRGVVAKTMRELLGYRDLEVNITLENSP